MYVFVLCRTVTEGGGRAAGPEGGRAPATGEGGSETTGGARKTAEEEGSPHSALKITANVIL